VDDAIYDRNRAVEDLLNVKLEFAKVNGNWTNRETFKNAIQSSVLANDGAYDFCCGALNQLMPYVTDGFFANLLDLNDLDFSKDWWFDGFTDNMTINGQLYGAVGDAAMTMLENMCVVMFNKKIAEDFKINDLYQVVSDGGWTFDRFNSLTKGVSSDLDGNSLWDKNDLYGWMTTGIMFRACCASFEIPATETGDDGLPGMAMGSERHAEVFAKVSEAVNGGDKVFISYGNTDETALEMRTLFSENKALFMFQTLASAQILRDMEMDFGILPYPKYDDAQKDYYTQALETHTVMTIPVSAKDPDVSAAVLEALAETSLDSVTPAYFETAIKDKYVRDEESAEMLDLIRGGIRFNFGFVNSVAIDQIASVYDRMIVSGFNLASEYASRAAADKELLKKLLENYQ